MVGRFLLMSKIDDRIRPEEIRTTGRGNQVLGIDLATAQKKKVRHDDMVDGSKADAVEVFKDVQVWRDTAVYTEESAVD
jgi:hypothetical protein